VKWNPRYQNQNYRPIEQAIKCNADNSSPTARSTPQSKRAAHQTQHVGIARRSNAESHHTWTTYA